MTFILEPNNLLCFVNVVLLETDCNKKTGTTTSCQRDDERSRHTAAQSQTQGKLQDGAS